MARKINPSLSRAINRLLALVSRPKHTVDPDANILLGAKAILDYLDMSNLSVLNFWVENFAFPAIKRPDNGMWMSSMTAIDHWLFMMAAAEAKLRREQGLTKSDKHFDRFRQYRERQKAHANIGGKEQVPEHTEDPADPPSS